MSFLSSSSSKIFCHHLSDWRTSLRQSLGVGLLHTVFYFSFIWERLLFPHHSWTIVSLDIEFMIDNSFLSPHEKCSAHFWPLWFQIREAFSCGLGSPIVLPSLSTASSRHLCLPMIFKSLFMMDSWMCWGLSYLVLVQLLESVCLCCSSNLGSFYPTSV